LHQMDPQVRRQRTLEAVRRTLLGETLNQPVALILEDLHWIDGETEAFLELVSESIASARFLLLVNHRPEYDHVWGNFAYFTELRLDPLREDDSGVLLTGLLGDDPNLDP